MIKNMNWFMIPTKIFERANDFYNVLLDTQIELDEDYKWNKIWLIKNQDGVIWCISDNKNYQPSIAGVIIYLDTAEHTDEIINRVIPAWGKIKMPKTQIWKFGYVAHIEDSEGNLLWLFQKK